MSEFDEFCKKHNINASPYIGDRQVAKLTYAFSQEKIESLQSKLDAANEMVITCNSARMVDNREYVALKTKLKAAQAELRAANKGTRSNLKEYQLRIKNAEAERDKVVGERDRLRESIENIQEYAPLILLHLPDGYDPHIDHYVQQILNWASQRWAGNSVSEQEK